VYMVQGDGVHETNREVREINGRGVNGIKGINGFVRSSFVIIFIRTIRFPSPIRYAPTTKAAGSLKSSLGQVTDRRKSGPPLSHVHYL
jgi:hypothetical protein